MHAHRLIESLKGGLGSYQKHLPHAPQRFVDVVDRYEGAQDAQGLPQPYLRTRSFTLQSAI